ncbi:MAG TPA: nuclear transport factor 2 family protein [Candidatus Acidoferrum sp.]|nr:nuclear transport factor 2 family protein [Candidatus Acidoferrum sp.]
MLRFGKIAVAAGMGLFSVLAVRMAERNSQSKGREEIEAFNNRFLELHLKMDTPGIMAMWAEDGVVLMQGEAPILGRKKITAWLEDALAKAPGYKVTKQEMQFHDILMCGDWATEWATEHQVARAPEGKPNFEGYGKMAMVLHREANGEWKIKQAMWNVSPKP